MGKVKPVIAGIFAVAWLLGVGNLAVAQTLPEACAADQSAVYVSEDGIDSAAGTYAEPVQTLAAAYERATERDAEEITIYVSGEVGLGDFQSFSGVQNPGKVVLCGSALVFDDESGYNFYVPAETVIQSIALKSRCHRQTPAIYAQGNRVEIAADVTVEDLRASGGNGLVIYGGSPTGTLTATDLMVLGGNWQAIYGGGREASVAQNVSLTVGGSAAADAVYGGGEELSASVGGDVSLTISGGSYVTVYGGGNAAEVLGTVKLRFCYGTVDSLYGGGREESATTGKTQVSIGDAEGIQEKAEILSAFRGSGMRGGLASGEGLGTTEISVYANAHIREGVQFHAGGYMGKVAATELTVYGGIIETDLYGGGLGVTGFTEFGNVSGDTQITIRGGQITGNLYGGGQDALTQGIARVMLESGTITGNVYGGGNAAGVGASEVVVALADEADMNGNIFGGSAAVTESAKSIQGVSRVELRSGEVNGSVFGGSETSGDVSESVCVEVTGEVTVTHGVFGGGRNAPLTLTPTVTVLPQAVLSGDIYGGGMGRVSPTFSKAMNGQWEAFCARFRTSRSYLVADLADAAVPSTSVTVDGTVHGSVYGGGLLATVGDAKRTTWDQTVTVVRLEENARVDGSVYGGGRGQEETDYAVIFGSTSVLLNGGSNENGAVFGGGQIAPVAGSTCVRVWDGEFLKVFGGSRDAVYDGSGTGVFVIGGTVSEVYGGGSGPAAVTGNASVIITGGMVEAAYAGGLGAGTTDTTLTITGGRVATAYAGGNNASITGSTTLTVLTTDRTVQHVDTVFAGNNEAPMDIQPTLDLVSGRIGTVYCGGNGGIMTAADSDDIWYLTYEFDAPDIEIDNLFAGCNHTSDTENTSNVTLNLVSGIYGTVYGGNDGSGYMNNTNIVIDPSDEPGRELGIGTVYGGGRMAACPKTQVTIFSYDNAQYPLTVYGGGNRATVTKEITIRAGIGKKGTAHIENLYGGSYAAGLSIVPRITTDDVDIVNFFD